MKIARTVTKTFLRHKLGLGTRGGGRRMSKDCRKAAAYTKRAKILLYRRWRGMAGGHVGLSANNNSGNGSVWLETLSHTLMRDACEEWFQQEKWCVGD